MVQLGSYIVQKENIRFGFGFLSESANVLLGFYSIENAKISYS